MKASCSHIRSQHLAEHLALRRLGAKWQRGVHRNQLLYALLVTSSTRQPVQRLARSPFWSGCEHDCLLFRRARQRVHDMQRPQLGLHGCTANVHLSMRGQATNVQRNAVGDGSAHPGLRRHGLCLRIDNFAHPGDAQVHVAQACLHNGKGVTSLRLRRCVCTGGELLGVACSVAPRILGHCRDAGRHSLGRNVRHCSRFLRCSGLCGGKLCSEISCMARELLQLLQQCS